MKITNRSTVAEIASADLSTIPIFQEHKIDFCCGGDRPIAEVADEKGIDLNDLLSRLRVASEKSGLTDQKNWSEADLSDLIDHIENTHHKFMLSEIPRLQPMIAKVISVHGDHYPSLIEIGEVFEGLVAEIQMHLMKEEQILFPIVKQMEADQKNDLPLRAFHCGSVNNPIRVMFHEHDNAGAALAKIRDLTNDYDLPQDACTTFRAVFDGLEALEKDLHIHIHLENNILFPRSIALENSF